MARMKIDLSALEARVGHSFSDPMLLRWALTHVSAAAKRAASYERLEFLGDRVLGLIIAHMLFETYPDQSEGELSRRLAALVRKETCAEVAESWGVGPFIRLGDGEAQTGGRKKQAILGDSCEAIIGAVYIDRGLDVATDFVHRLFDPLIEQAAAMGAGLDWKTSLQEVCAALSVGVPEYVIEESGPDHQKSFVARVRVADELFGAGQGASKKEAEQHAAQAAYEALIQRQPAPDA